MKHPANDDHTYDTDEHKYVFGHGRGGIGGEQHANYQDWYKQGGPLLWAVRLVLVAAVVVHMVATLALARRARTARPLRTTRRFSSRSPASRNARIAPAGDLRRRRYTRRWSGRRR